MKRPDSTEMDRLLRRHGRRGGEALLAAQGGEARGPATGPHMDTDELSAYAEGALPEGARARYVAHLADCDNCRKLVTDLALAAGIVHREESIKPPTVASASRSWREWFAALFSPPVLRYAAPALALLAVIVVVAVVAMRDRRPETSVARNEQSPGSAAQPVTSNTSAPAPAMGNVSTTTGAGGTVSVETQQSNTGINPAASPEEKSQTNDGVLANKTEPTLKDDASGPTFGNTPADAPKPGQPVGGVVAGEDRQRSKSAEVAPATTAQPPPAPAPTPAPELAAQKTANESSTRDNVEEQKKAKASDDKDEQVRVERNKVGEIATDRKQERPARRRESGQNNEPAARSAPMGAGRTATPGSRGAATTTEREDGGGGATRSVGGRRFRRQGNAWVDTEYSPPPYAMNVARSSDQYRALVADEPGLRSITQQLPGEVIVVWGRRAYRFY